MRQLILLFTLLMFDEYQIKKSMPGLNINSTL